MSLYSRFTAWLSGWPESKAKREREEEYLFAEEEQMIRENNRNIGKKPKGLNPKKKAFWNHENKN
jgi:hypothetical protein